MSTNFADRRATTTPTRVKRDDKQLTAAVPLKTAAEEDALIEPILVNVLMCDLSRARTLVECRIVVSSIV